MLTSPASSAVSRSSWDGSSAGSGLFSGSFSERAEAVVTRGEVASFLANAVATDEGGGFLSCSAFFARTESRFGIGILQNLRERRAEFAQVLA